MLSHSAADLGLEALERREELLTFGDDLCGRRSEALLGFVTTDIPGEQVAALRESRHRLLVDGLRLVSGGDVLAPGRRRGWFPAATVVVAAGAVVVPPASSSSDPPQPESAMAAPTASATTGVALRTLETLCHEAPLRIPLSRFTRVIASGPVRSCVIVRRRDASDLSELNGRGAVLGPARPPLWCWAECWHSALDRKAAGRPDHGLRSGVLISAVSFELVEEAFETSSGEGEVAAEVLLGSLIFYAGDSLIDRMGARSGRAWTVTKRQAPRSIVLGIVLDGIPESLVLGSPSCRPVP